MPRTVMITISGLFFILLTLNIGQAKESATKEECIDKCKEAVELIKLGGSDEALTQMNQPDSKFRWKDTYVFVFETKEAKIMSHPVKRFIGWSMMEFRSADNILVFQEILKNLANVNEGWISYKVLVDQKPPPVQKTTYYIKVPGENLVVAAGYYEQSKSSQSQHIKSVDTIPSLKIEEFARSEGIMHGIAFDGKGHMFVGKNGKEILKVSPDGAISLFTIINEAEGYFIDGPGHTFLYDMEFDNQGILYAAAEDRILRISGDGEITPMVKKKFSGNWGACGIALDQKNNVFYAYDNKIMKITHEGLNELFLDGAQISPPLEAIVGIDFGPEYQNIFACDGKLGAGKLVRIPIGSDGSAGQVQLLYHDQKVNLEYMAFDKNSNVIIKGPWSASFIRVHKNGQVESLKHDMIGFGIQTISRGGQGFDQNAIFGTHMPNGIIYKIVLP